MGHSHSDIQQKPSPLDTNIEDNAKIITAVLAFIVTMLTFCLDHLWSGLVLILAIFFTFCFKGTADASVCRGTTGTQGIDLNAFRLDPYDMHHVRRQTRGAFTSAGHCVWHYIGKLAGYDDMGVN